MKRLDVVSALFCAVLICTYGIGQSISSPESANSVSLLNAAISAPTPVEGRLTSPFLFVTNSFSQTNLYIIPGPQPILPPRTSLFDSPHSVSNALPNDLRPGLYKTEPYTSLVLVPGPHPDDKCIIGNRAVQPTERMPMRQPELQFIPRKPSQ